jgi:hypothetical protein
MANLGHKIIGSVEMYLFVLSADISPADSFPNALRIASEDGDVSTNLFKMPALCKTDITIQMGT